MINRSTWLLERVKNSSIIDFNDSKVGKILAQMEKNDDKKHQQIQRRHKLTPKQINRIWINYWKKMRTITHMEDFNKELESTNRQIEVSKVKS